tara:strand:- start:188 stop:292 length:105 start_codon:yes stop_codon:yes gene_type:complete
MGKKQKKNKKKQKQKKEQETVFFIEFENDLNNTM